MFLALTEALRSASTDDDIRAVVLTGAGGSFSAGVDLGVLSEPRAGTTPPSNEFLHTLAEFPKPVIAAVAGHAIGVGFTATLLCDLVYAADTTRFRVPFVKMGLVPEAGSSELLPLLVGHQQAMELFLFGEELSAERALSFGLVNEVLPPDDVLQRSLVRAAELSELDPVAVRQTKALLGLGRAARAAMEREEPIFEDILASRR
jgi:enoyl-CoA hydratase/carnithine racemase